jgi:large subunit ribosomal protein L2
MGKNLIQQRRGKGNTRYRSPSHRFLGKAGYSDIPKDSKEGVVTKILDAPGKSLPLAEVTFDGKKVLHVPHNGITIGQKITVSGKAKGNISRLGDVLEGTKIYNIELRPGDGGRLCRSSGSFSTVVSREGKKVVILLPSKRKKTVPANSRVTIGVAAGSGRKDKPFMKAGNKYHAMKSMGKLVARSSATAMNVVDHPFGGSNLGKQKSVARSRSPGRKVGSISPKRTGKSRKK